MNSRCPLIERINRGLFDTSSICYITYCCYQYDRRPRSNSYSWRRSVETLPFFYFVFRSILCILFVASNCAFKFSLCIIVLCLFFYLLIVAYQDETKFHRERSAIVAFCRCSIQGKFLLPVHVNLCVSNYIRKTPT